MSLIKSFEKEISKATPEQKIKWQGAQEVLKGNSRAIPYEILEYPGVATTLQDAFMELFGVEGARESHIIFKEISKRNYHQYRQERSALGGL